MSPTSTKRAALEQIEAEKQRRIEEKIERGEVVSVPSRWLGVRDPKRRQDAIAEYKAGVEARLRAAGEPRPIHFEPISTIHTGVPRSGADWWPILNPEGKEIPWAWPRDGRRETLEGAGKPLADQYQAQGLNMLFEHAQFDGARCRSRPASKTC